MHSCDNPPCVNPKHLSEGTARLNAQDRESKGRGGDKSRARAFTKEQHEWIITNGLSQMETSRQLGINQGTVSQMRRGLIYTDWFAACVR